MAKLWKACIIYCIIQTAYSLQRHGAQAAYISAYLLALSCIQQCFAFSKGFVPEPSHRPSRYRHASQLRKADLSEPSLVVSNAHGLSPSTCKAKPLVYPKDLIFNPCFCVVFLLYFALWAALFHWRHASQLCKADLSQPSLVL